MRRFYNVKKLHDWNEEDEIIAYFCEKFGTNGLSITAEKELAESVISTTNASLTFKRGNFRHLITGNATGFEHVSDTQRKVLEKYAKSTRDELKDIVNKIIANTDLSKNKKELQKKLKDKKNDKELQEIFLKMGKDPKKMKKVS
jgi:hypothetical protein